MIKKTVTLFLLGITSACSPVYARFDSSTMIDEYDPKKTYTVISTSELDSPGTTQTSKRITHIKTTLPIVKQKNKKNGKTQMRHTLFIPELISILSPGIKKSFSTSTQLVKKLISKTISSFQKVIKGKAFAIFNSHNLYSPKKNSDSLTTKAKSSRYSLSFSNHLKTRLSKICIPFICRKKENNSPSQSKEKQLKPTPPSYIRKYENVLLPPMLGKPTKNSYYSMFQRDPFSNAIPKQVKDVYTWDRLWNPAYNPKHFLQCTTYVAMVYALNGKNLKGKLVGDAANWTTLNNTFRVYASNSSHEPPRVLDTMVWAKNNANHVGIVVKVTGTTSGEITIANGNSTKEFLQYTYSTNSDKTVRITNSDDQSAEDAWVPSHWLRLK